MKTLQWLVSKRNILLISWEKSSLKLLLLNNKHHVQSLLRGHQGYVPVYLRASHRLLPTLIGGLIKQLQ